MFSFRNYKWNLRNIPPISVGDGCPASLPTCVQRDRSPPRPLMSFSARNSFWEHRAIFRSSSCKKQYQWDYGLCIFHSLHCRSFPQLNNHRVIVILFAHSLLRRHHCSVLDRAAGRMGREQGVTVMATPRLSFVLFSFSDSSRSV